MDSTTTIWNEFKGELLGFIKSRINDSSIAEDLLQEVFIKIHLKKETLKDNSKLTSWVYQITRNKIIDYYRKKNVEIPQEQFNIQLPEELNRQNKDFTKCLLPFINQLSFTDKDIINQISFGGVSQKDYALNNNLSYSATKSKIQRARKKLKTLFLGCCAVETDKYGSILSDDMDDCDC